jgi:hypothetical protein
MRWVLVLGLVVLLAFPAHGARQTKTASMTIRLVSTETYSKTLTDRPPISQVSKGDLVLVESTLRNAVAQFGLAKGAVVGNERAIFKVRSSSQADLVVESDLPRGSLRAEGRIHFGGKQTYAVTGGLGRFAHARGTGEARALGCHCNRRLKTYRLQLP